MVRGRNCMVMCTVSVSTSDAYRIVVCANMFSCFVELEFGRAITMSSLSGFDRVYLASRRLRVSFEAPHGSGIVRIGAARTL